MIREEEINGNWKGDYTQEFKGGDNQTIVVDFEIELKSEAKGFSGVCYDIEIEEGNREKSSIKGFIDGEIISFVKQYENAIYLDDETEEYILEKNPIEPHPEIHYYGTYNADLKKFEGTWEIEVGEELIVPEEYGVELVVGEWWMKKL